MWEPHPIPLHRRGCSASYYEILPYPNRHREGREGLRVADCGDPLAMVLTLWHAYHTRSGKGNRCELLSLTPTLSLYLR